MEEYQGPIELRAGIGGAALGETLYQRDGAAAGITLTASTIAGNRLGACHGVDIPFVFDTLGSGTEPLWGPDPPQQLADAMHAAWVAFATNGDCGWANYHPRGRARMRFDTSSAFVDDPLPAEWALWEGVR